MFIAYFILQICILENMPPWKSTGYDNQKMHIWFWICIPFEARGLVFAQVFVFGTEVCN